jgi:hypothetical protein
MLLLRDHVHLMLVLCCYFVLSYSEFCRYVFDRTYFRSFHHSVDTLTLDSFFFLLLRHSLGPRLVEIRSHCVLRQPLSSQDSNQLPHWMYGIASCESRFCGFHPTHGDGRKFGQQAYWHWHHHVLPHSGRWSFAFHGRCSCSTGETYQYHHITILR